MKGFLESLSRCKLQTKKKKVVKDTTESSSSRNDREPSSSSNQITGHTPVTVEDAPLPDTSNSTFIPVQDTSVHVVQQGVSYNIAGSAKVNIHYGTTIAQSSSDVSDNILQTLKRSRNAEYDVTENVARGPCTPQTRTSLLQKLEQWASSDPVRLYWLNGIAGTGKTTISYSFCDRMKRLHRLAASFFCSRSLKDCRDLQLIIPTLAYQIAIRFPSFKYALVQALQKDPEICRKNLDSQLHTLLINPWNVNAQSLPKDAVIVLDALDECDGDQSPLLKVLFDNVAQLPVKILITSRPDYSIHETLKNKNTDVLSTFILHDIEKDLVEADIVTYLQDNLSGRVPGDVLDSLKELSGTLFIVAATLTKLFTGANVNPRRRLALLQTSLSSQNKALESLDAFYKGVMVAALQEKQLLDEEVEEIKDVLFAIVCACDPLTREGLAGILDIPEEEVDRRLASLYSVVLIPNDRTRPVVLFHASFADFIQSAERSGRFCCHPGALHVTFVERCLKVLNGQLHQNLCDLNGHPPNDYIDTSLIYSRVNPSLRYAAVYWVEHWVQSDVSSRKKLLNSIERFISTHTLHWFECLSLLSRLPVSIQSLELLLDGLDEDTLLFSLAYEYLRLVQYFYDFIKDCVLGIYSSTFAWIPTNSPLKVHNYRRTPYALCGIPAYWTGPDRIINVHSDSIDSISISEDETRLASGSNDKTVRIWNLRNQIEDCVLTGHTGWVTSVAMFRDGNRVVSGSEDQTIRVWDTKTLKTLLNLNAEEFGKTFSVHVAISPDEKLLASGHEYGQICVWDAVTGQLLQLLVGHEGRRIRSVSFTADGTHLVSGSDDKTARVWSAQTGEARTILYGHSQAVVCVACSPVGDRIMTGSGDRTARVWDLSGKEPLVLRGHLNRVLSVAFMPNGNHVATGCSDNTIRMWELSSGNPVRILTGVDSVRSLIFFPKSTKFASCANNIAIWNTRNRNSGIEDGEAPTTPYPVADIMTVALASNGRRVLLVVLPFLRILDTANLEEIFSSRDQAIEHDIGTLSVSGRRVAAARSIQPYLIELWELGGKDVIISHISLEGHTGSIRALAFSHDESRLVSSSYDQTARVWDTATGELIHILAHPYPVRYAVFSHNDTQIVISAAFSEPGIHVWDSHTGKQLHRFEGSKSYPVAFTPDDRYLIMSDYQNTTIFSAKTLRLEHEYKNYDGFTTLDDGISYALSKDGWVCRFGHIGDDPRKVLWIPVQYQPSLRGSDVCGPIFTTSPQGIQVFLARADSFVTVVIPHDV